MKLETIKTDAAMTTKWTVDIVGQAKKSKHVLSNTALSSFAVLMFEIKVRPLSA